MIGSPWLTFLKPHGLLPIKLDKFLGQRGQRSVEGQLGCGYDLVAKGHHPANEVLVKEPPRYVQTTPRSLLVIFCPGLFFAPGECLQELQFYADVVGQAPILGLVFEPRGLNGPRSAP